MLIVSFVLSSTAAAGGVRHRKMLLCSGDGSFVCWLLAELQECLGQSGPDHDKGSALGVLPLILALLDTHTFTPWAFLRHSH